MGAAEGSHEEPQMTTNYTLDEEQTITLDIEVFDTTLGLVYEEEIHLDDVRVTGRRTDTPATWMDPPECDMEVEVGLTVAEVAVLVSEQYDEAFLDDGLVIVSTSKEIFREVEDMVEESSWETEGWDML